MTMNGDTYGSSRAGVARRRQRVRRRAPTRYPEVDARRRRGAGAPDLVLAPSEPYPFGDRHVAELEAVAPVVLVDGQDLFWWGSRTPARVARLRDGSGDST